MSDEPDVTWSEEGGHTLISLDFKGFELRSLHIVI